MKQGKFYIQIMMVIFFCAIVGYLGFSLLSSFYSPMTTTVAMEYEARDAIVVSGYVVREETVLTTSSAITAPLRNEGEKVGNGQAVAMAYDNATQRQTQVEIDTIASQLEQLAYVGSSSNQDDKVLDNSILTQILAVSRKVAQNKVEETGNDGIKLKGLVLRRYASDTDLDALDDRVDSLQNQLSNLESSSSVGGREIIAPHSGYFSATVDGYESVLTPENVGQWTVQALDTVAPDAIPQGAFGKLIAQDEWYYVATVSTKAVEDISVGDTFSLSFSADFSAVYPDRVQAIGDVSGATTTIAFYCKGDVADVTMLREQTAHILLDVYDGLGVPKSAIRVNEAGQSGVYILESAKAKWKTVDILYDNGENYVVALDKSSTANLWPGDEIIVLADNLYDGKVVAS